MPSDRVYGETLSKWINTMPLTAVALTSLPNNEMTQRIESLFEVSPEFSSGHAAISYFKSALAKGDKLYVGLFNDKPVCAVCVRGQGTTKTLQYIVVHLANRGRGLAHELIKQTCLLEESYGVENFIPGCGAIHRALSSLGRLNEQA